MEIPYTISTRPDTGLWNAKVGIWLFLASEVMLFGALFSSYILLRVGAAPGDLGADIRRQDRGIVHLGNGVHESLRSTGTAVLPDSGGVTGRVLAPRY